MRNAAIISMLALVALSAVPGAAGDTEYAKAMRYLADRDELYFAIYPNSASDIKLLSNELSIDRIDGGKVIAYANKGEFETFLTHKLNYEVLTPPCFRTKVTMSDYAEYLRGGRNAVAAWDKYPTYDAYLQIMQKFETDHPQRAKLEQIGSSVKARNILALKVSSDVSKSNGKPRMLQVSTVHGDEVMNYINSLHIIDTLLSSYGTDQRLTKLLDAIEFWFVPLLNPDGTYKGGNGTVQSAQRYNSNGVDLNRNYPCPCGQSGNHAKFGLYSKREPEAAAIMKLYERYYYHLITDLHGGVEIIMWPYGSIKRAPCDEEWYKWVARRFADTVHKACKNNGYLTYANNGIGNIYSDLYECHGTSIDYAIFYMRGRCLPIENSYTKLLEESKITTFWNYNKEAFVNFYENLLAGVRGTVRDSRTKAPIVAALVREATHDFDSAHSYTDSAGFFLRFIQKGSWSMTVSKPGYTSKTIAVSVNDYAKNYPMDVELNPIGSGVGYAAPPAPRGNAMAWSGGGVRIDFAAASPDARVEIYTADGALVRRLDASSVSGVFWNGADYRGGSVPNGCYVIKAKNGAGEVSKNFVLSR